MNVLLREIDIRKEDVNDSGEFSGYGSVFDVIDSYGDVVVRGAFAESLSKWNTRGKLPKMLGSHGIESAWPIGVWTSMIEDSTGLRVTGRLALETELGRQAHALLKMGALDGLSIGFNIPKNGYEWGEKNGKRVRYIKQIDLWEVSLVTFPANTDARVGTVKATKRQIESMLRDACGLSRRESNRLASMADCRDDDEAEMIQSNIESLREIVKILGE